MSTPDLALTQSLALREQYADRTDVLDKVKALVLLSDGVHATTELVARYYEISVDTLDSLVRRNRKELERNGMHKLAGEALRAFKATDVHGDGLSSRSRELRLFNRKAILNVGQLLEESPVAARVRRYLLDVEELAPREIQIAAIEKAAISRAQLRMLEAASGIVRDQVWLDTKARVVIARGLGEEPEIDPLDEPLYVPDFLKEKGITRKRDVASIMSWFGRRMVLAAEAHGIEVPEKRTSELPNGTLRGTNAWTERHRPLFEEVWDRYYAADYDSAPAVLL